jgi:hypothetical protein
LHVELAAGIEFLPDRAQTGLAASLSTGATDDLPSLPGRWGRNAGLRVILRNPEPGVLVEVSMVADREAHGFLLSRVSPLRGSRRKRTLTRLRVVEVPGVAKGTILTADRETDPPSARKREEIPP